MVVAVTLAVAFFCERRILVPSVASFELRGSQVYQPLFYLFRYLVHEAHRILVAVAEAHPSAYAGFIIRYGTRPIECRSALVLVPYVNHEVHVFVRRIDPQLAQVLVPFLLERGKFFLYAFFFREFFNCKRTSY